MKNNKGLYKESKTLKNKIWKLFGKNSVRNIHNIHFTVVLSDTEYESFIKINSQKYPSIETPFNVKIEYYFKMIHLEFDSIRIFSIIFKIIQNYRENREYFL